MSDFHATERLIGGLVVVGTASLLNWSLSQGGEAGLIGTVMIVTMVLGGLWAGSGVFELVTAPKVRDDDVGIQASHVDSA